jgi:putative ABC transport system permease protein
LLALFRALILRPLRRDLLRSSLTVIAVALGVGVVIAIGLAGDAAAGSFESSLTTVVGNTSLEILANGGIDEQWMGKLAALPVNARFAPVMEAAVKIPPAGFVTLYGVDTIGAGVAGGSRDCGGAAPFLATTRLAARLPQRFTFRGRAFCVVKIDSPTDFAIIDIADMQLGLQRYGKLDRIDVFVPAPENIDAVERAIRETVPAGYQVIRPGTRSAENQKMLRAFRWNLQILSYIALVVGAFLIYNTVSISVVRRRPEIGVLRALGAGRTTVLAMFLSEAILFGLAGAALGLLIGRVLAVSMVALISQTVRSLYTSSAPSPIHLTGGEIAVAFAAGLSVAIVSAWAPAREAMRITPVEAMGRGSREVRARLHLRRNLFIAAALGVLAWLASLPGPMDGRPILGYCAALLSVGSAAFAAPALVASVNRVLYPLMPVLFGAEGLLASRGLSASGSRTSVVVSALATAIAMMASVGIMVGSFRETVSNWLDSQLRADLYVRAAGPESGGEFASIPPEVAAILRAAPGIEAIDEYSAIPIRFEGQHATLGAADLEVQRLHGRLSFLNGDRDRILRSLRDRDRAIVTEPFAEKHHVRVGQKLTIPLGARTITVTVAGIYFDYASEQGFITLDRSTLLRYLPGQRTTSIAVYLKRGADAGAVLSVIENRLAEYPVAVDSNASLRREAMIVFDRTFAITWALEGVAILVAMLGAANTLLALVLDRRRELGMLRYLGAASSQIRRMILVEAGLLGLFALLLGAVLGLVLSRLLVFVINKQSFGWTIQFHLPALALAGALLLIWAVTVLSGLYPGRIAARLKPIEVIHEE